MMKKLLVGLLFLVGCSQYPVKESKVITLKENGGWCWYQDERAIIKDGKLLFTSVATDSGIGGQKVAGNIDVTIFDLENQHNLGTITLHENLQQDDHNTAALQVLNDGNILAVYSKHGSDKMMRYRTTKNANNFFEWTDEKTVERSNCTWSGVCYSNVFLLQNENLGNGRLYNFYRGENYNPNFVVSNDQSQTWENGAHLINFEGRPYVKYASDGFSKIHFVYTEAHPRDYDNSIYHAYLQDGKIYNSYGDFIKEVKDGPIKPEEGTCIYKGDKMNVAWTMDLHLDKNGFPFTAYSVQKDNDSTKIEYRYARFGGETWNDHFLAHAGTCLYPREADYSGLVALDPQDPNTVYISADVDPVSGEELISDKDGKRHYEIFMGRKNNNSLSWTWQPITQNSKLDNIRPIIPISSERTNILLWLRGTYSSYTNYNLDVVGIVKANEI